MTIVRRRRISLWLKLSRNILFYILTAEESRNTLVTKNKKNGKIKE